MSEEIKEASSSPVATSTSAPSGGKKSNKTTVVSIVVVVVVVLVGGYLLQHYLARKTAGAILSNATGSNVSVSENGVSVNGNGGTIATGDKATWPATMPSDVPKFGSGNISAVTSSAGYWTVVYENCNDAAAGTEYIASLTSTGWSETATYDADNTIARSLEKGEYILNLTFSSKDKGASITVQKQVTFPE